LFSPCLFSISFAADGWDEGFDDDWDEDEVTPLKKSPAAAAGNDLLGNPKPFKHKGSLGKH